MWNAWNRRSFHGASKGLYRVEYCESASRLESPAAPSSAPVNSDSPGPAAAPGSASQPQSHGPAQVTSVASDNNIFSHCIIAEDNNSFHNCDAGLQFLSDKEISGKLFELRDFIFTRCLWERIVQNSRVA